MGRRRRGSVRKRCAACSKDTPTTERRCPDCGHREFGYSVVVSRTDPATGKRRRVWISDDAGQSIRGVRHAEKVLTRVLSELDNGTYAQPARTPLGDYAASWLAGLALEPTTRSNYSVSLRVHVVPRLGAVPLAALTPEHLDGLYRELERHGKAAGSCRTSGVTCADNGCSPDQHAGLAPKSVRHVHTALRKALQDAYERGHVARNVADLANPPTPRQARSKVSRDQVWTAEQVRGFLAHVRDDRLFAAFHLTLTTGVRRMELLGLRWSDLDPDGARLTVGRQTVTTADNRAVWSDDGKTAAAERTVALDPATVTVLREHRRQQAEERLAAGPDWRDDGHNAGLVFTMTDGRAVRPKQFTREWVRHAKRAGLPPVTPHGGRHTYATLALRAGVPVHVVSKRLGHASPEITLQVYSHVLEGDDEAAAQVAAEAILS